MNNESLDSLYNEFLNSVKENNCEQKGWKKWGYGNSKLFLTVWNQRLSK